MHFSVWRFSSSAQTPTTPSSRPRLGETRQTGSQTPSHFLSPCKWASCSQRQLAEPSAAAGAAAERWNIRGLCSPCRASSSSVVVVNSFSASSCQRVKRSKHNEAIIHLPKGHQAARVYNIFLNGFFQGWRAPATTHRQEQSAQAGSSHVHSSKHTQNPGAPR